MYQDYSRNQRMRISQNQQETFKLKIRKINPPNSSEINAIFSTGKRIELPLFFDSAPYQPYRWPIFLFYLTASILSIWYLFRLFLPGITSTSRPFIGWIGCAVAGVLVALPYGTFYGLNLLFKPKLLINESGITFWSCGKERSLTWADIKSITVADMSNPRFNNPIFWTIIRGNSCNLRLPPYLGVDTKKLAKFLEEQLTLTRAR